MILCFARRNIRPLPMQDAPQLLYVSRTEEKDKSVSRILHAHEDFAEIILIAEGGGRYLVGEQNYDVKPGDLLIYNSGVIHDEMPGRQNDTVRYCCAIGNLHLPGLRDGALIPEDGCPLVSSGERFEPLRHLYDLMFSVLVQGGPGAEETCHHLMLSLLEMIHPLLHGASPSDEPEEPDVLGRRIKNYIDGHYAEDISLQSIARDLNINQYYLSHVFKDMSGFSPMNYVLRRRMGEAQNLLIETSLSITEIASRMGYDNVSHFISLFTKNMGISPSKYRKNYLINRDDRKRGSE